MRKIYSIFPYVGWCKEGIYIIDSIEEVDKSIQTETRRRDSIDENIEMLKQHRAYLIRRQRERGMSQGNLFGGNND